MPPMRSGPSPRRNRRIVIRAARRTDDTIEVIVSDCGGGIPEDRLQKVFEPFFTTKVEGLGMGLSISVYAGRIARGPNVGQQ